MALGWLSLLKHVPWSEVISNAPAVADSAKKLWSAAARRPQSSQGPSTGERTAQTPDADTGAALQAQLASLEAATFELRNQLVACAELVQALAEQNAQLIKRAESTRIRVRWLSIGLAVLSALAAVSAIVLFNP